MPNYDPTVVPSSIANGDLQTVWNAEAIALAAASAQVAITSSASDSLMALKGEISCTTAPTTATFNLQVADTDADANYLTLDSVTILTPAKTGRVNPSGVNPKFARWQLSALTGSVGNVTGKIGR